MTYLILILNIREYSPKAVRLLSAKAKISYTFVDIVAGYLKLRLFLHNTEIVDVSVYITEHTGYQNSATKWGKKAFLGQWVAGINVLAGLNLSGFGK